MAYYFQSQPLTGHLTSSYQHPASHASHASHASRARRPTRFATTQSSHKPFRGVRSMRELTEAAAMATFRTRFDAGRGFDLDDDLEFCPALLTEEDLLYVSPPSSDRSSLSSVSTESSPVQQQIHPSSYATSPPDPSASVASPSSLPLPISSHAKLHQPAALRMRNPIPIVNPSTGMRVPSPPESTSPALHTLGPPVGPPQFTYDALVKYLQDSITEEHTFACRSCLKLCIGTAREGDYLHEHWPDEFPRIPESKCADRCTEGLPRAIRRMLQSKVGDDLPQHLQDHVRALPVEQQRQAMLEGSRCAERAARDVGTDHPDLKCEYSDGGTPPLNPKSPENSALKKGSPRYKNNIVPYERSHRGRSPRHGQTGPPSARDGYATEEPFHTPLKINRICVLGRRVQGISQAVAERRCRYKPFAKKQRPVSPLAIPVPGSASVWEPGTPLVAPGLGGAGNALLLKGV
ncbi:MAG: hypothetical protein M1826_002241 [Phylliscum demangeonii]|nr:MAG: hypothetical protein M1826_002241 [Phylliscum demangeonii]